MKLNVTQKQKGSSVVATISIWANNNNDDPETKSYILDINRLALVQFGITQISSRSVLCKIMIQKQPIDSNVKVKVLSEDLNFISERYCSEEAVWEVMGNASYDIYIDRYSQTYRIQITICAYIAENSILDKLYKETDSTDFHLSTAEGSVAVHKTCLMALSDVFKRMLSQGWKETDKGSMQLPGITLKTLQGLKQYMYLGTLPDDDIIPLLDIASCYLIKDLKEKCISKLAFKVKPEDFYGLLQYSMENKMPELTFALMQITPESVIEKAREINVEQNISGKPKEE